jgi:hypothetical protein
LSRSAAVRMIIGAAALSTAAASAFAQSIDGSGLCPDRPSIVAACSAAAPSPGQTFSGSVIQVIDGRTLCVAKGPSPEQWILVRLEGDDGGRGALMAAAFAKPVACVARKPTDRGLVAQCAIDGVDLGQAMRTPSVEAVAASWR